MTVRATMPPAHCEWAVLERILCDRLERVTPERLPNIVYWLPRTCAYRRLHEGKPLLDWHPLISGTTQSVHDARISVQGWTLPETSVPTEDWEDYLIEETP